MGARPPLLTISTITYKVVVDAPAERAICTLWSYNFAPNPPPPLSRQQLVSLPQSSGEGDEGVGDRAKTWPSKKSFNTLCHIGKSYKDDIKARGFASLTIRHSNHWFGQIRQKQFLFLAEVSFRSSCLGFPLTC